MRRLAETPAREKSFSLYEAVHQLEVKLIRRALDDPGGSVTKAARLSGVTRQTLNAMLDGGASASATDLRHSCATLLLAANEHPKVVIERLGHASIVLTLDTYSHVLPSMQQAASEKLESILFKKTGTE